MTCRHREKIAYSHRLEICGYLDRGFIGEKFERRISFEEKSFLDTRNLPAIRQVSAGNYILWTSCSLAN